MPDDRLPCRDNYTDLEIQLQALTAQITLIYQTMANLGLMTITPISQADYNALSPTDKLNGVFDIYDAVEPQIDGDRVSYDSNNSVNDMINGYKIVCDSYVSKTGITSNTAFNLDFDNANIKSTDIPMITMTVSGTSANSITFRSFIENGRVRVNTFPLSTDANAVVGYWIIVIRKV